MTEDQLRALHSKSLSVSEFFNVYLLSSGKPKPSFFSRLFRRAKSSTANHSKDIPKLLPEDSFYLDKAWHGLHFLFTDSAWGGDFPAAFIIATGEVVSDEEFELGPARSFDVDEVRQISDFLESIDENVLRAKLDFAKMMEEDIYPTSWSEEWIDSQWDYLYGIFVEMREFIKEAKTRHMALLIYIN